MGAVADKVRVVFTKYDGRLHWHAWLDLLGEDEHGVWLGSPRGTIWQRGESGVAMDMCNVTLVPRDAWWVASFNLDHHRHEVYIDLSTVPVWQGDQVTMVDLDLDVVRLVGSGSAQLLDEDEFAEHRVLFGYPEELVRTVSATATALMSQVTAAEPFVGAYRPWLARVTRAPAAGQ
jgi:protein associated with RNAse G/E